MERTIENIKTVKLTGWFDEGEHKENDSFQEVIITTNDNKVIKISGCAQCSFLSIAEES